MRTLSSEQIRLFKIIRTVLVVVVLHFVVIWNVNGGDDCYGGCYGWTTTTVQQRQSLPSSSHNMRLNVKEITTVLLLYQISHHNYPTVATRRHQHRQRLQQSWDSTTQNDNDSSLSKKILQIRNENSHHQHTTINRSNRRTIFSSMMVGVVSSVVMNPNLALAAVTEEDITTTASISSTITQQPLQPPLVQITGDTLKLFNDGRTYERQGNIMAAQRLYQKVTQIVPNYIYGWSNLGNTQIILNKDNLKEAENSYNIAINLCQESIRRQQQEQQQQQQFGIPRCSDLYILLLNRGCLLLNIGQYTQALVDLQQAEILRGQPDPIILQNLARAYEYNNNYNKADYNYNLAISMSNSNEVNPFWLRSAMVKFQLGNIQNGYDLLKRVVNRFPDAPEVKAAYAVFLLERNNNIMSYEIQQTFLDIPIRQRLKYSDSNYITKTICWPPAMIQRLNAIIKAVGDDKRSLPVE